jgi:hypothetical protein
VIKDAKAYGILLSEGTSGNRVTDNDIKVSDVALGNEIINSDAGPVTAPPTETITEVNFSDIYEHWAEADIKQAVSGGIVKGFTDGTFKLNNTV